MNTLTLIGHVGNDATTNNVNGKQVINFNVAVTKRWKDKEGNEKEVTKWFSVSYWNDGKVHEWIKKGTQICVMGEVGAKSYMNAKKETEVQLTVDANFIELLSNKKD